MKAIAKIALVLMVSTVVSKPAEVWSRNPRRTKLPPVKPVAVPVSPETNFKQLHPMPKKAEVFERSNDRTRAVVLIHGFRRETDNDKVAKALFRDWQVPDKVLVQTLAKDFDVYAYAYGQNAPVPELAEQPALIEKLKQLKKQLGYEQIVLVGHSAGGLIARQVVEDHPDCCVSKVVQVCSPNGGSAFAKIHTSCKSQIPFLDSLTKEGRQKCLEKRNGKKIPGAVEFVCILGNGAVTGDGVVSLKSMWPEDLQDQGIPVQFMTTLHFRAMRSAGCAAKIAEVARTPQPRWDADKVAELKKKLQLN